MTSEHFNPEQDRARSIASLVNVITGLTNIAGRDIDPKLGVSWHGQTTIRAVRPIITAPQSSAEFLYRVGLTATRVADPTTGLPSDAGTIAEVELQFYSAPFPDRAFKLHYNIVAQCSAVDGYGYAIERQTKMLIPPDATIRLPRLSNLDQNPAQATLFDPPDVAKMERQLGLHEVTSSEIVILTQALTEQWNAVSGE